jgi:predicted 2-oxoglutarate/Fe(II)-dependent dioxygenase YbiX
MANEDKVVTDPRGNHVLFTDRLCQLKDFEKDPESYDEFTMVIEKPAVMIEVTAPTATLYYYRSVGWNNFVLIAARRSNEQWEAIECSKNPSPALLSELLKKGTQVI